ASRCGCRGSMWRRASGSGTSGGRSQPSASERSVISCPTPAPRALPPRRGYAIPLDPGKPPGSEESMRTYRHDTGREDHRRLRLRRHEAVVEARRRFAEACSALSYGKPLDPGAPTAPGSFVYRIILARRAARAAAAAAVIAAAAALGGVAILSP